MHKGKILLVGIGPGAEEHMTFRARAAIAEADVVVGYSTYIKLVEDLLDGKLVVRKGMTEEIDRCVEAYEQARQGKVVALISSGDAGIYGMAGPTYEVLLQSGWTPGDGVDVEVVPGATALTACAALVGAPLTHDFCSISLSDLLTPWPVIARRLESAARADFVVALYNPKSGRRTGQIVEAQRILLQYRAATTPVALVKSAYRDLQSVQFTTLDRMAEHKIGMLTTVLIGNSSTYLRENLMITPRGYANKYQDLTGDALAGERAGRSLSMGLDGWQACVRRYMRDAASHSLRDIARHFDAPIGAILSAIGAAAPNDYAGEFEATSVIDERLGDLPDALRDWGQLRAVVRSDAGAVSELMVNGADLRLRGDWLSIANDQCHLHIDWNQVKCAWLMRRADTLRGVQLLDHRDESVCNLLLLRRDSIFDVSAETRFNQSWLALSQPQLREAIKS